MWQPLMRKFQLHEGCIIRQIIHEGNEQFETIYKISKVGEYYFFIQAISQNGKRFSAKQQLVLGYRINRIMYFGFELLTEQA